MSPAALAAAALAAGALALVLRAPVPGSAGDRSGTTGSPRRAAPALPALALGAAVWCAVLWTEGRLLALAVIGILTAAAILHLVGRSRRAAAAERTSEAVLAACTGLAADLRAGAPPQRALERAAADWTELAPVASAARLDADVPTALRMLATRPGAGQLAVVAAAWQVAHRSGAGLAPAVSRAAESIVERRTTRRLIGAELASARATSRLMAVLPFVMLLLGGGLGTDPVGFLTGTTAGLWCLAAGLCLSYLGLLWLDRIANGVLR